MDNHKHPAENLLYESKSAWYDVNNTLMSSVMSFSESYKTFLNLAKTEREAARLVTEEAKNNGFVSVDSISKLQPGSKVMLNYRNKAVMLAVIGSTPIDQGCNIIGSHTDAPRLDLKPNPLYEKDSLAMLKTHYYGGIKKYQWLGMPLALHGVVCFNSGTSVNIVIGEDSNDPVFTITDLLPHLAKEQMNKKMSEAIKGEGLNIVVGGIPINDSDNIKNPIKLAVLNKLNQQFGITEEDFISAEFEVVPAWPARNVGLDSSMIGSYGQDDRVCVYTSLKALLDINIPTYTSVAMFMDKEEIGSSGNTGMAARTFENFMAELIARILPNYNELALRRCLAESKALSADVNAGLDPNYENVMEKMNACKLGYGITITKYTGSRGKVHANDAHAEFLGYIRNLLNQNNIPWQTGELGKVDEGGGGTIAYLMAVYGMDVVDCGVPILGMHSPFEVASKVDIYSAYQAYKAFFLSQ